MELLDSSTETNNDPVEDEDYQIDNSQRSALPDETNFVIFDDDMEDSCDGEDDDGGVEEIQDHGSSDEMSAPEDNERETRGSPELRTMARNESEMALQSSSAEEDGRVAISSPVEHATSDRSDNRPAASVVLNEMAVGIAG